MKTIPVVSAFVIFIFCLNICDGQTSPLFQPWGGAARSDWQNSDHPIILTDMTEGNSHEHFSEQLDPNCWKVIPYELENNIVGKMIWTGPEMGPPEVSIPLQVSGWHAIFVGLFSAAEVPTTAWLKLDSDPTYVPRYNRSTMDIGNTEEVFFKAAKLNPQNRLVIQSQKHGFPASCGITHIVLIPMTEKEEKWIQEDRADSQHHTMAATFDGFSYFFLNSPRSPEELRSAVEIFRDTDIRTLLLHSPGADKVIYPSKTGYMKGIHAKGFPRVGDRYFMESIRSFAKQQINPEKVLIDAAHEMGMKVHVGIRPAGWTYVEPFPDYWESPFYQKNPQWRCEDKDGNPIARMSWAVPEVRNHLIDVLRERIGFGADGAHLVFCRGYPVVLFESPARELFEKQFSADPRKLDDKDSRIMQFRSDIVTLFMHELRQMLDDVQPGSLNSNRLVISAMILGNESDNLQFGVDVRRLIQENLLDEVYAYAWDFGSQNQSYDIDYLRNACSSSQIPFSITTASYFLEPYYSMEKIGDWLHRGTARFALWDASVDDMFIWAILTRLGHTRESVHRVNQIDTKPPLRTLLRFRRLGEQFRDTPYKPWWGG